MKTGYPESYSIFQALGRNFTGKIEVLTGVHIPIVKKIYKPVLKELEAYKISFVEEEKDWVISWV